MKGERAIRAKGLFIVWDWTRTLVNIAFAGYIVSRAVPEGKL
jgi:hypothetical protein